MTDLDAAVFRMVREFHAAGWWRKARAGRLAAAIGAGGQPPAVQEVVASLERLLRLGLIEARRTGPNPQSPWVYVPAGE